MDKDKTIYCPLAEAYISDCEGCQDADECESVKE